MEHTVANSTAISQPTKRLVWIDIAKGIGILWVVYFHFFTNYVDTDTPPGIPSPMSGHFLNDLIGIHAWDSVGSGAATLGNMVWLAVSQVGFHAVGLFVLLGGWSLATATWRRAEKGRIEWRGWYEARFVRLYPMYWCAHLLLLLMPFTWLEPIDSRFLVSLTGLRWINLETTFLYGNAAWWYFSMLIQLYAIFPVLFVAMRRFGLLRFGVGAAIIGFGMRYMLLVEWKANGLWLLGANALSRLPEFAIGMILGISHLKNPTIIERWLLGPQAVALGFVLYAFAPQFQMGSAYILADCYTAICCSLVVVGLSGLIEKSVFASKWLSLVGTYSFGLFLTHQPLVTWLGQRIKSLPIWEFLLVSVGVLWLLSAASIALERAVNALTDRLYAVRKS